MNFFSGRRMDVIISSNLLVKEAERLNVSELSTNLTVPRSHNTAYLSSSA